MMNYKRKTKPAPWTSFSKVRGPEKAPRKRVRKVSKRQAKRLALYGIVRAQYLAQYRWCQVCTCHLATEIHHKKGRRGNLLFDDVWFMAICRMCHGDIGLHPKWAMERGYIVSRLAK